jgi:outer membrane protein assembly factor BamB/tRNA A-37 threonylcarbamoyl transferase component Bud32
VTVDTQRLENYNPQGSGGSFEDNILPKGAVLQNRYEVNKVLGVGGMGAVYLAQDLRFTGIVRWCAIKEMISTTPDPHVRRLAVQSFMREANLLVQLRHQGIPQIYDFFSESVRSYLVMEYIQGQDLEEVLEATEGMLKEEVVLDWAIQICEVLLYLHSQNPPIIFRDMKPSNVMVRDSSSNKITMIDFGIAKAFEAGQKGTMIGTEGYSPPEQYKGIADPRGDIYALGATLHHLLTKRDPRLEPPFTFHEEPPRLLNPTLTEAADAVIMKALEYDPDKRFPSAQAFKDALQAALERRKTPMPPVASTQAFPEVTAPATALLKNDNLPPPPPPGVYLPQAYPPQYGYPPQFIPPGYGPGHYPPPTYPGQPYPPYPVPGGEEESDEDSILPIWKFKCEDEIRGSVRLDGNQLYVGVYDNNLYALNAKTGDFQWKYATDGGVVTRPFVYKGLVIFGSEDQVTYAVNTQGRLAWTCPTEGRIRSSPVVEFDHAFFGSDDHRLYAVNAQSGRVIWRFDTTGPVRSSPVLGDEMVYVGSEDGHVYAVDMSSGKPRWKFRTNRSVTSSPAIAKDLVIVGSSDKGIYALDSKSGYTVWRIRTGQAVISSPTVRENTIYIGSADKNVYAIDARNGKTIWKFDAGSQIISTPAVTDEAVYFGTTAGEVYSIGRKDHKIRWKFKTGGAVPSSPFVADGVVYIGSTDKHVYALPA